MIYLFSTPLVDYATTNIEKVYQTIEKINDSYMTKGKYIIKLYDESTGDLQGVFEGEIGNSTHSFIKFIYDTAKSSRRIDLIHWATNEISKYDNANPTINSLIYSLWEKANRGTDQTK